MLNDFVASLRWQDIIDVAIITVVVYQVLVFIRGTRAAQMLSGVIALFATYLASQYFELYTLNWVLDNFIASLFLVMVVLFQNDIRRALAQMGSGRLFVTNAERVEHGQFLEEIVRATATLSGKQIGALLAIQRDVGLGEYVEEGTRLDSRVSRELILSVFHTDSPMHDGAVIVQDGRVTAAGCFLPLTSNPNVSKNLGTRHRAAIGLTDETDAVVVVVSEEDGKISLVREGRITRDLDPGTLRKSLQQLLPL